MKIRHYRAPDMRQALRQVREAQGPDAVILSSRRISGGVEVVAAVDYDADGAAHTQAPEQREHTARGVPLETCAGTHEDSRSADHERKAAGKAAFDECETFDARLSQAYAPPAATVQPDVNEELRTLRRMLETQLATLAWNDLSRRAPTQAELLEELSVLGLAQDLAAELVAQMPTRLELSEAHRLALAMIARRIETAQERWLDDGGVVALVGATGVGKTTLVAKLAARWVLRHGPRELALVSTDSIRIGAQEQIHTLGRLLGAPAYAIDGPAELPGLLAHLADKRLVLIDTAGLGQRDPRLAQDLAALAGAAERLEVSLVLSAAAQAGSIEEAVERFAPARASSCIYTKLDEATSLGGALSMLVRSRLPLAYLSDGQRVPEDLSPARAHQVVARAVELARRSGASADEDLLRRRFGGVAHALA